MKTIKIFAVALAALTIASCSKEEIGGSNNSMGGNELNTPTYATFKFNIGGASSRADYNPSENPGDKASDDADKAIGSLQLLIFNATTEVLEHNSELVTADNGSKTVLLTAGKKKIFFVANSDKLTTYTKEIKPGTFTGTLSDFYAKSFNAGVPQQDQTGADRTFDFSPLYTLSAAGAGLPMSNTNEVTYTLKAGVSEAEAKAGTAVTVGESLTNSFDVQLYYMVAKARLILKDGVENTTDESKPIISDVKYAVRNLARFTKYIQNVPTTGKPQSYYYGETFPDGKVDFDAEFDNASNINVVASKTPGSYLYVPENNNSIVLRGQSSYFAIKATFKPVVITAVAYDVNTKVKYTSSKLAGDNNYIYTIQDVEGIPAGTYFKSLEVLEAAAWIMKYDADFDGSADAIKAAKLLVKPEKAPTSTEKRSGDYMSFKDATSYYRLDLGKGDGASTEYGVLRSNKYDATINKITGPGTPTEGDLTTDPIDPVSAKTYISATIKAAVWTPITQSADL